jgi:hypothetical protein
MRHAWTQHAPLVYQHGFWLHRCLGVSGPATDGSCPLKEWLDNVEWSCVRGPSQVLLLARLFKDNKLTTVEDEAFEKEFGCHPPCDLYRSICKTAFSVFQMTLRVNSDVEDVSRLTYSDLIEGFKDEVVMISENLQALGYFKNQASLSPSEALFLNGILTRTLPEWQWPGALS